jgi:hypothetical protein
MDFPDACRHFSASRGLPLLRELCEYVVDRGHPKTVDGQDAHKGIGTSPTSTVQIARSGRIPCGSGHSHTGLLSS